MDFLKETIYIIYIFLIYYIFYYILLYIFFFQYICI